MRRLTILIPLAVILFFLPWRASAGSDAAPCVDGAAAGYPCHNVDLVGHLGLSDLGADGESVLGNDHWGWTDPATAHHYVLFGLTNGTAFVDITVPESPTLVGFLPGREGDSIWRDVKVYEDHAFIVGDVPLTEHGLQVFDLTQLRAVVSPPATFTETAHYDGFGPGHNIWINEATGFLYAFRTDTCEAATHVVDVRTPTAPAFAGCVGSDDAPLSDSECVLYAGPDAVYQGREICFTGSDDNVSIDDVTDKAHPQALARTVYPGIARAHQGALTADQQYWLISDTMDELTYGHNTRTYVFDVSQLSAPVYLGHYEHANTARDHNLYVIGNRMFQTNWKSGLRVFDISSLPALDFTEVAYFDTAPDSDSVASAGSWSNYPWWPGGLVTVSDTEGGLFILRVQPDEPTGVALTNFGGAPGSSFLPALLGLLIASLAGLVTYRRRLTLR
jgi:choice-of-anchor B domain-containing protein